jgi:archaellum component FlaC
MEGGMEMNYNEMMKTENAKKRIATFEARIEELQAEIKMVEGCTANRPEDVEIFRAKAEQEIRTLKNGIGFNRLIIGANARDGKY